MIARLQPKHECHGAGCHRTAEYGHTHCPAHKHLEQKPFQGYKRKAPRDPFYQSAAWRKLRAQVLARDPLCRDCRKARARHVDHVIPRREGGPDTLDNLRGLCPSCHSKKTIRGS